MTAFGQKPTFVRHSSARTTTGTNVEVRGSKTLTDTEIPEAIFS